MNKTIYSKKYCEKSCLLIWRSEIHCFLNSSIRFILALILFRAKVEAYLQAISSKLCFKNPSFCFLTYSIFYVSIYNIFSFRSGSSSELRILVNLLSLIFCKNYVFFCLPKFPWEKDLVIDGSKVSDRYLYFNVTPSEFYVLSNYDFLFFGNFLTSLK